MTGARSLPLSAEDRIVKVQKLLTCRCGWSGTAGYSEWERHAAARASTPDPDEWRSAPMRDGIRYNSKGEPQPLAEARRQRAEEELAARASTPDTLRAADLPWARRPQWPDDLEARLGDAIQVADATFDIYGESQGGFAHLVAAALRHTPATDVQP